MSGIAGIVRLNGEPAGFDDIQSMIASMAGRGPDRRRTWHDGGTALGQALLATTPEAVVESQPWVHPESRCVVVSDSRLDNRPDLLHVLGLCHSPVDAIGDGELFHAAYQRWGASCAEHLLGDFAFAIWDPKERRLFCARDVMGVRPFYWFHRQGLLLAFGSEAQAILRLPGVPMVMNEGRIADAIDGQLEGIDKSSTFFVGVMRLPPAHTLLLADGRVTLHEYWRPMMRRPAGLPQSEGDWIDGVRACIEQAVVSRLRSSRRVGSMLSGGVDSSTVVALGSRALQINGANPLPTFSATDAQRQCEETRAIQSMHRSANVEPTTCDLASIDEIAPELRRTHDVVAEPFDATMTLINCVYRAAAVHSVVCVMDGVAADNLYSTNGDIGRLSRSGSWKAAYRTAVELHREDGNRCPGMRALGSIAGAWAPEPAKRLRRRSAFRQEFRRDVMRSTLMAQAFAGRVRLWERYLQLREDEVRNLRWDESGQTMSCMTAAHLTVGVERYGRVAAMYGLEPRHPFLDRRVIELHAWLPMELRSRNGAEKWALRRAMSDVLPADVLMRQRVGHLGFRFTVPTVGLWIDELESHVARASGSLLEPTRVREALGRWRSGGDPVAFRRLNYATLTARWLAGGAGRRTDSRTLQPIAF